jgi:predicted esterase
MPWEFAKRLKMFRMTKIICIMAALTSFFCFVAAADEIKPVREKLARYNVEIQQSSVSGLSAGGFMAGQFFVAYSGIMSGVGVFAGGPYGCARGNIQKALKDCMSEPSLLTAGILKQLVRQARNFSVDGRIDSLENLPAKRIFLFGGTLDKTVLPEVVSKAYDEYLEMGVLPAQIFHKKDLRTGHALPTLSYGNSCEEVSRTPWISACGYDGAGETLQHIHGALNPPRPVTAESGKLIEFAQRDFIEPYNLDAAALAGKAGLNEFGYAFIPRSCQEGKQCRIHVVFHGCSQIYNQNPQGLNMLKGGSVYGLQMVLHAGYNEWAHTNQFIVLYPQAQKNEANPKGCFDWWGYLGGGKETYLTREAPQMKAVRAMMQALSGK